MAQGRQGIAKMLGMSAWSQAPAFAQSLLIGLSIAAPVGPVGLLTIQRTLAQGPRAGLATGLGAALADAVYGAIGALGAGALIAAVTLLPPDVRAPVRRSPGSRSARATRCRTG
jgi:hypothetical protein